MRLLTQVLWVALTSLWIVSADGGQAFDRVFREIESARTEADVEKRASNRPVTPADKVFLPDREERIAQEIAHLTRASRGAGEAAGSVFLYMQRQQQGASAEELEKLEDAARAASIHDGAITQARVELANILDLLSTLKDRRAVRLIGPLLNENGEGIKDSDMIFGSVQNRAVDTLRRLQFEGVINLGAQDPTLQELRLWWGANKDQFGPIQKELLLLDDRPAPVNPTASGDVKSGVAQSEHATPVARQSPEGSKPSTYRIILAALSFIIGAGLLWWWRRGKR